MDSLEKSTALGEAVRFALKWGDHTESFQMFTDMYLNYGALPEPAVGDTGHAGLVRLENPLLMLLMAIP